MDSTDVLMLLDNPLQSDQRVEKEAKSLVQSGMSVTILATAEHSQLPATEMRDGYTIKRILDSQLKNPLRSGYGLRMQQALQEAEKVNFNILHCHDYFLLELAAKIKKDRNVFLTYDSHEYLKGWPYYREIPTALNRWKGKLVWKSLLRRESRHIQATDLLITPSEPIRQRMLSDHHLSARSFAVRNIPLHDSLSPQRQLRKLLSLDDGQFVLVHSGSVYMSDDFLAQLTRLVESNLSVTLLFIGNRPRHFELQQEFGDHPKFRFLDYDPHYLLGDLAQCDAGLAYTRSSSYEAHWLGSSNRIMEYSIAGLPIIGTAQPAHTELKDQFGHVATFNDADSASLEKALQAVFENYDEWKGRAKKCRSELQWNNEFAPVVDYYKHIKEAQRP